MDVWAVITKSSDLNGIWHLNSSSSSSTQGMLPRVSKPPDGQYIDSFSPRLSSTSPNEAAEPALCANSALFPEIYWQQHRLLHVRGSFASCLSSRPIRVLRVADRHSDWLSRVRCVSTLQGAHNQLNTLFATLILCTKLLDTYFI